MKILGKSLVTYRQCESWIKGIGTVNKLAIELLPILWKAANNNGIVPEIFIAQAMVETGYFNFGGVINASFHNTCGLKVNKGGSNTAASAHMRFKSWEEGIQAHADHLALYAGAPNFPKYAPNCKSHPNGAYKANGTTADPRHFPYLHGKCKTVEELSGTWATNKKYAETILIIVNQIRNIKEPALSFTPYKNGTYNAKAKITADSLNVRAGRPGSKKYNNILGTLKKDEIVTVRYCLDNWFGILYNGKQAFICGKYVNIL
jgi:N-acetylmuramoyl-L-alanine amidase